MGALKQVYRFALDDQYNHISKGLTRHYMSHPKWQSYNQFNTHLCADLIRQAGPVGRNWFCIMLDTDHAEWVAKAMAHGWSPPEIQEILVNFYIALHGSSSVPELLHLSWMTTLGRPNYPICINCFRPHALHSPNCPGPRFTSELARQAAEKNVWKMLRMAALQVGDTYISQKAEMTLWN